LIPASPGRARELLAEAERERLLRQYIVKTTAGDLSARPHPWQLALAAITAGALFLGVAVSFAAPTPETSSPAVPHHLDLRSRSWCGMLGYRRSGR
jgi:hypothetical protein